MFESMLDGELFTKKSVKPRARYGAYSRVLRSRPMIDTIDGRSTIGRLIRDLEAQLYEHIGGREAATITQKLLVARLIRVYLQISALDEKLSSGDWTDKDARTYGGLQNALRLTCRELGMTQPPRDKAPSLAGHLDKLSSKGRAA